jgi:hypothetical protein
MSPIDFNSIQENSYQCRAHAQECIDLLENIDEQRKNAPSSGEQYQSHTRPRDFSSTRYYLRKFIGELYELEEFVEDPAALLASGHKFLWPLIWFILWRFKPSHRRNFCPRLDRRC